MKWFKLKFSTLVLVFLFFVGMPVVVFAQDAPPVDPASLVGQLLTAVQGGHWGIVVGIVLSLVTYAVRQWILPSWKWAQTDKGGAILAIAVAAITTVGASLATGTTSVMTILDALASAMLSAGAFNQWKKLRTPAVAPAKPPGT